MRTLTIKSNNGNSSYEEGWHELLISKAEYKEWNGTKCIDVYFDSYPEYFNMRIYEKIGTDGEEFAIGQLYRFANAGISSSLEGSDGTKVVKLDDSPEALLGKKINVYLYKEGKYSKPLGKVAPTIFQNAVESFDTSSVEYWKGKAVDFFKKYVEPKMNQRLEAAITNPPQQEATEVPF